MLDLKQITSVLQLTPGSILKIRGGKKEYVYLGRKYVYLGRNRKTRALEVEATGDDNYIMSISEDRKIDCLAYKIDAVGNYGVYVEDISIDGEEAKTYYSVYQIDMIAHGPAGVYNDVDEALDFARDYHEEDQENKRAGKLQEEKAEPKQTEFKTLDFLYRRASENLKRTEEAFNSECNNTTPNIDNLRRLSERTANHAYYKSLISASISSAHK